MKARVQHILQRFLGLPAYLKLFAWYKILTLQTDTNENDFFYFLKLIKKEGLILDIGANLGIMSFYLSNKFQDRQIHAFEPMPNNLETLRWVKQFFRLKNMTIHDYALGNETGTVEMVLPVVDSVKKQGLSHVLSDDITEFNEGITFTTAIDKLDNVEALTTEPIAAIKIDVENFEYHVFSGATEILQKHKPIIYCELWDNDNRYKCFDFLANIGYGVFVKHGNGLEQYDDKNHHTQNFFFIPEDVNL